MNWEHGKSKIDAANFIALCDMYRVNKDDIFYPLNKLKVYFAKQERRSENMEEKLALTQQLVKGLKAWEWRRIRDIIDHQYEGKANKLALDDLSCESIKKWFDMEFTR